MRYTKEIFLEKAHDIHGVKYDYSQVEYVNQSVPVKIICPEHGLFEQTPARHLHSLGCPQCAKQYCRELARKPMSEEAKRKRRETNLRKYGATTFAGSKQAKELHACGGGAWSKDARKKAAATCQERFGAKTWAESNVGRATAKARTQNPAVRKTMSEIAKSETTRQHYRETSRKRCGFDHWTQSDEGKQKLHSMFSTEQERFARSERMKSEPVQEKIRRTSEFRYGTPYYWQSDEGRVRLKLLLNQKSVQDKIIATKKKRGTLNSSKPEKNMYQLLVDKFGEEDVKVQYRTDVRYPFACDFYIVSLDLFIELNASWLHGGHWFDATNPNDEEKLSEFMEKAEAGKPMYQRAVYIWTKDDPHKRQVAMQNNINYLVFWKNDLSDVHEWLNSF